MEHVHLTEHRKLFSSLIGYLMKQGVLVKDYYRLYRFSDNSSEEKFHRVTAAYRALLGDENNPAKTHIADQIPIRMWSEKPAYSVWGTRYKAHIKGAKIKDDCPEHDTLKQLSDVCSRVNSTGYDMRIDLMYADEYGKMNGLKEEDIEEYYQSLTETLKEHTEIRARLFKWSDFIKDNKQKYEEMKARVIDMEIRYGTLAKCTEVARNLSPVLSAAEAEKVAKDYLIERVTEANLINDLGQFKLSLSSTQMDFMETMLPRIYPIEAAFPWRR